MALSAHSISYLPSSLFFIAIFPSLLILPRAEYSSEMAREILSKT
jgi:hypothetical protein